MSNALTVGQRLAIGFGITVLLSAGIAGYAAVSLNKLNGQLEELATNRMVKMNQFASIKNNFQDVGSMRAT